MFRMREKIILIENVNFTVNQEKNLENLQNIGQQRVLLIKEVGTCVV